MNPDISRKLVAEGVIGLFLTCGVFFMVVEPMSRAAREASAGNEASFLARSAFDLPTARIDARKLVERVDRFARASAFAEDELDTLNRLTEAAEKAGLTVENVEQRAVLRSPVEAPALMPGASAAANSRVFGFTLSAIGPYDRATAFIRDIQDQMGFASIVSARVTPAGDTRTPLVRMSISTMHTWVDSTSARAAAEAATRALAAPGAKP